MTVKRPTKAAMIYQKAWAMDMFVGVNIPPMLMLIPPIFMVAVRYVDACLASLARLAIDHSKQA
jgi:hypothetical protein